MFSATHIPEVDDVWLWNYLWLGNPANLASVTSQAGVELSRSRDGWTRVSTAGRDWPVRNADRSTLQELLDDTAASQSVRLEPLAALAAEVEGSWTLGAYSMFTRPLVDGRLDPWYGDEEILALYGKLDAGQRSRLLKGQPLTWIELRPEQRRLVEKIVYGQNGVNLSDPKTGDTVEPLEVLGNGIRPGSTISAREHREPTFFATDVNNPTRRPRQFDLSRVAQSLLYQRRPELRPGQSEPSFVIDRIAVSERRMIDFTFTFEQAGRLRSQLQENSRMGPMGSVEQLSAEIKERLNKRIAELEQAARQHRNDAGSPAERPPRP